MTEQSRTCAACGAVLLDNTTYCGMCGADIDQGVSPSTAVPDAGQGNPPSPSVPMTETKARNNGKRIIVALVACSLVLLLCCGGFLAVGVLQSAGAYTTERPKMAETLDKYLIAMSARDTIEAGTYLASDGKIKFRDLKGYVSSGKYDLFTSYKGLRVDEIDQLPFIPINYQVVNITGTMTFSDGSIGVFEAVLRKEGDRWRIVGLTLPDTTIDAGST